MQACTKFCICFMVFLTVHGVSGAVTLTEGLNSLAEFESDAHHIFNVLSLLSVVVAFCWLIIPQYQRDI